MPSTHVRIPDKLHERVQAKAAELGISVNQTLVILIAQGLEPRVNVYCQPPEPPDTGIAGDLDIWRAGDGSDGLTGGF